MAKHAYCILAHNEPELFRRLVLLLDHPENDLFIHIDKRSDISLFQTVTCQYSQLVFMERRLACNWGSLDIVKAEITLFETALRKGPYAYYHLLSGVDLPLKSQEEIHRFLDANPGRNFIGFCRPHDEETDRRTRYYHLRVFRPHGTFWQRACNRIDRLSERIQRKLGIRVHYPFRLYKGAQWVTLSHDFVDWLVEQKRQINRLFRFSFIPDERVIQSFFMASPYAGTLYRPDGQEYQQCMREIDWQRGSPYTWKEEDYDELVRSERWFARKFSSDHMELVDRLFHHIKGQED